MVANPTSIEPASLPVFDIEHMGGAPTRPGEPSGYTTGTAGATQANVGPSRRIVVRPPTLSTAILQASYEGIAFPVTGLSDTLSNDAAIHRAYMVPGGMIEPTGYAPRTGTATVAFDNGVPWGDGSVPLFPDVFQAFLTAVRNSPIGTLVHPHYGPIRALLSNVRVETRPTTRSGVMVTFTYTEDGEYESPNTTDQTARLLDEAGQFDNTIAQYRNTPTTGGYTGRLQAELAQQSASISYVQGQANQLANALTLAQMLSIGSALTQTLLLNASVIAAWPADMSPFGSPILTSTFNMLGLVGLVVPGQSGAAVGVAVSTAQSLQDSFVDFAAYTQTAGQVLRVTPTGPGDTSRRTLRAPMTPTQAAVAFYGDARYVDLVLDINGPPGRTGAYPAGFVLTLVPVAPWTDYSQGYGR